MKIKIELLSDLCTASGEAHNSLIDCDVTYDEWGIPYIPAKRLKGCIREAALELVELGLMDAEKYNDLFGVQGNGSAAFQLSNARIQDFSKIIEDLRSYKNYEFTNQQNVLQLFTDTRTQTAVNLEKGVAEKNSLRTMRVIQKGLIFEADCTLDHEEDATTLSDCVSLVKHIGVSRTRGLGLVNMQLESTKSDKRRHVRVDKSQLQEKNRLHYIIHLNSSMICKSEMGNQAETQDYIPGSKVLGLIAGALGRDAYSQMMKTDDLIVSNAYIMNGAKRCLPCRISLQKVKDQAVDGNGNLLVKDMLYPQAEKNIQMTPIGATYLSPDGVDTAVFTEISYHHQRPQDKSVGRATGKEDGSSFYQLAAIREGQSFSGYIYASCNNAEKILDAVEMLGNIRMGYGRSSEFGDVDFVIDTVDPVKVESKMVKSQVLTLVSDMILYNEYGMPSTELSVLKKYLEEKLQIHDLEIQMAFLQFATIGGYNVTWQARKPIFHALGKGSVMIIHSESGFDRKCLDNLFIGERTAEGYGEIILQDLSESPEVMIKKIGQDLKPEETKEERKSDVIEHLLEIEFERLLEMDIRNKLSEHSSDFLNVSGEILNASIAKIRLLLKTETSYAGLKEQVEGIVDANKNLLCKKIVEYMVPSEVCEKVCTKMEEQLHLSFTPEWSDEVLYKKIYRIYITELKYRNKTMRGGQV